MKKTSVQGSKNSGSEEILTEKIDPDKSIDWTLRGVFPPNGDDPQAWILDKETGVLHVVSKGSVVKGIQIIEVKPERVLTSKGSIYN